ncbi:MAG: pre-peptidase C-terminal domain-containing protein, partial [Anaerolineae bacterium]
WVDVTTGTTWVSATGTTGWSYPWILPLVDRQVYTLTARARDHAGNWGTSADVTVTVDTVAPTAAAPNPHRSPWVTSTIVYTWVASTDGSGILGYLVNITNTAGYTTFTGTTSPILTFTGAFTEGAGYYARVQAVDGAGNAGGWSDLSAVVTPDLTAPGISNPAIVEISDYFYVSGLTLFYTNTMSSAQTFYVQGNASDGGPSGLEKATFSEAFGQTPPDDTSPGSFGGSYDVSPGATESGNITVTIYDRAGNTAIQVYTYTLDGDPPYTGAITISNGAPYVTQTDVTLALYAADAGCGVAQMCVSNSPSCTDWENYATTKSWTLSEPDGEKTVSVWFRDHLGNTSGPYADTVILDREAPSGSITIDNGALYATQVTVTLSLTATDGTSGLADQPMRFSNDGISWSDWEAFTTPKQWTLDGSSDGLKTVYVQYRDKAGHIATYSDTIILDRRPPVVTVTVPLTSPVPFFVSWEGTDPEPGSGVVSYSVAYSVTHWVSWFPSTTLTGTAFYTATPGQTVVFSVTAYDRAGNAGTGNAQVYVDYHRVYIPLVLRNWVWWYQYDRYEPNDTPAQAYGPLSSGQVITAYIWDATDRDDYYWFQPSANAQVTITLTNIPAGCDFDLFVYYYQNGWQTAAQSNKSGSVDERVVFNAIANTKYYIRVYPYQGSSSTQSYRLSVQW